MKNIDYNVLEKVMKVYQGMPNNQKIFNLVIFHRLLSKPAIKYAFRRTSAAAILSYNQEICRYYLYYIYFFRLLIVRKKYES